MPQFKWVAAWKERARQLEVQTLALFYAYRDPRTPWYAKAFTLLVVAYAFSPIDLIPDFIPVLGYLDDLVLIPAGVWLAVRLVPPAVMEDSRATALARQSNSGPRYRWMGALILFTWLAVLALVLYQIFR